MQCLPVPGWLARAVYPVRYLGTPGTVMQCLLVPGWLASTACPVLYTDRPGTVMQSLQCRAWLAGYRAVSPVRNPGKTGTVMQCLPAGYIEPSLGYGTQTEQVPSCSAYRLAN
jgi:hypothetical protein